MTPLGELERHLLTRELRRLVWMRWLAATALAAVAVGSAVAGEWSVGLTRLLIGALAIGAYNAAFWWVLKHRSADGADVRRQVWAQLLLDLAMLTLIMVWTGGAASPVLIAFTLHMVLAGLLLATPKAYGVLAAAVVLVASGLTVTDQWPTDRAAMLGLLAWLLVQMLTTYLSGHVAIALRRGERDLQRQERRTQAVLDTAAEGIVTIDSDGIIESANPAAQRIFGYQSAEMIGHNISMLMPEPDRAEHDGYLTAYLRTGRASVIGRGREVTGLRMDGRRLPLDISVSEVKLDDKTIFTGIVRDLSERKRTEAELGQLHTRVHDQEAALAQSDKMAALGQMAAGVAHEIANPLASMDGLLQLAMHRGDTLDDTAVEKLRGQIARINELIRRMKDFAHPDDGAWAEVTVNDVVEEAVRLVELDGRARSIKLERDYGAEVGRGLLMSHAMQQVIVNLIINAIDAVDDVKSARIVVATRRDEHGLTISVTDNGAGISSANVSRIFDPFFTTKPVGQGTGLGLSISYTVVRQHHGSIEVESSPGEGTTMRVCLPNSYGREPKADSIPEAGSSGS